MRKNCLLSILVIAISLVIAASVLAFPQQLKSLVVEGILIDPGTEDAFTLVSALRNKPSFIVSPVMHEPVQPIDHKMYNGTALFLQVLEANDRSWVQLMRVYNENGELFKCVKGNLDMPDEEELSPEQCNQELSSQGAVVVLIELPEPGLAQSTVELSQSQIKVRPKTEDDIGESSFLILRMLYPNSEQVLEESNAILDRIRAS